MRVREQLLNMPTFVLPQDQEQLSAKWWGAREAAKAWGCSYSTAWHLIDRHPYDVKRQLVQVITPRGGSIRQLIPAGTKRPYSRGGGNPNLGRPEFQRAAAQSRWK